MNPHVGETHRHYAALPLGAKQLRPLDQALNDSRIEVFAESLTYERLRSLVEQKAKEANDEIIAARRVIAAAIEDRAKLGDEVLLGRLDTRLDFVQRYQASYEKLRTQVEAALSNHDEARFRDLLVELDQARDILNAESEAVRREMLRLLDEAMRDTIAEQNRSVRYGIMARICRDARN